MERRTLPGLDEVQKELSTAEPSARTESPDADPLELEEPGTWEDRRAPERPISLMDRIGRLLGRDTPDRR